MPYLVIVDSFDCTNYYFATDELAAHVKAMTVAYEEAASNDPSEFDSAVARLSFYRAVQESLGQRDDAARLAKLQAALEIYNRHEFCGHTIEVIEIDPTVYLKVLEPDIVHDLDRQIEQCLAPAAAETEENNKLLELEKEMDRQQAINDGDVVINTETVDDVVAGTKILIHKSPQSAVPPG